MWCIRVTDREMSSIILCDTRSGFIEPEESNERKKRGSGQGCEKEVTAAERRPFGMKTIAPFRGCLSAISPFA
jgi:hypothetical protein